MDWRRRRTGSYRYIRTTLSESVFSEHGQLDGITGFELDPNRLESLKVSGTLDYVQAPDLGADLVRIYYDMVDISGETASVALATMYADVSSYDVVYATERGTAQLYSVLRRLQSKLVPGKLTIPAGTVAIDRAVGIVSGVGLPVIADPSTAALNSDATFDGGSGDTMLTVVNWLCDFAGFGSAYPDAYGTVHLDRYRSPSELSPVVTFSDAEPGAATVTLVDHSRLRTWQDDTGLTWRGTRGKTWAQRQWLRSYATTTSYPDVGIPFAAKITYGLDVFDVPNVVVCSLSSASEDAQLTVTVRNDDPDSPSSTISRGYEITRHETVSDISGTTDAERMAALSVHAAAVLEDAESVVESVEVTHMYTPEFGMGDMAVIDYSLSGRRWVMSAVSQRMTSTKLLDCTTRFRRFIKV